MRNDKIDWKHASVDRFFIPPVSERARINLQRDYHQELWSGTYPRFIQFIWIHMDNWKTILHSHHPSIAHPYIYIYTCVHIHMCGFVINGFDLMGVDSLACYLREWVVRNTQVNMEV